ncbi:hypothetical protein [Wukongibacter sp. M2B1]|uniref:hypothetical protein n=1 Tax=Wukongibacter sp. M2B1 TaxID=3088895 RepID=UPI003D79A94D
MFLNLKTYLYFIETCYEDKDDAYFEEAYVTHRKKFTNEEFEKMCKEGLRVYQGKYIDSGAEEIRKYLIQNYGFEYLKPHCKFRHSEDIQKTIESYKER